jgi:hypothetical protein
MNIRQVFQEIKDRALWIISGFALCLLLMACVTFWQSATRVNPKTEIENTLRNMDHTLETGRVERDQIYDNTGKELISIDEAVRLEILRANSGDLANIMLDELSIFRSRDRIGLSWMDRE